MSQKDRAPHPSRGDSRKLLAIVQSRRDNPKGKGPGKMSKSGASKGEKR
jgi:hypothetical protein